MNRADRTGRKPGRRAESGSQDRSKDRATDDRDEDGGQFVAFVAQGLELRCCYDFAIDEKFQPVGGSRAGGSSAALERSTEVEGSKFGFGGDADPSTRDARATRSGD